MRWQSVPTHAIAWQEFDDECVVFNQCTGSTHLLGPVGAAVLQALLDAGAKSLTLGELQGLLQAHSAGAAQSLPDMLSELERLGLVQMEAV